MKQKKRRRKAIGKVQGFAMLYGRSSKAIRIPNGGQAGSTGTVHVINGGRVRSVYVERASHRHKIQRNGKTCTGEEIHYER